MSNHVVIHVFYVHWSLCVIEGIFNKEGWGGSKSAFKAFGRQLCCRPKAKIHLTAADGVRIKEQYFCIQYICSLISSCDKCVAAVPYRQFHNEGPVH
jgi:hypothetical protein